MDGDGTWGVPDEGVTCVEGELGVYGIGWGDRGLKNSKNGCRHLRRLLILVAG